MSADKTLAAGWRTMRFDEIAESITERVDDPAAAGVERYVGLEHLDQQSTKIRRWGSPDDVASTKLRFHPGDVVYARRRAYQRKLGVADFEGICSAHALVLRARPKACLPEVLPYFLQSDAFHERALDISVGSLSPTINWRTLAAQEFALPPIDEQERLVEVLGAAEKVLERCRSAHSIAKRQVCNLSIQLTTTGFTRRVPLLDVATALNYQRVPVNDGERAKRPGSVPYYGANGQVGTIDREIFDEPLVLFAEDGGQFDQWRTKAVAYRIDGPSWVNNHAHVLRADAVPTGWLYFNLRNFDFTRFVVGTTRTKLNRSALERLTVGIPEDLDRRLAVLESAEECEKSLEAHVEMSLGLLRVLTSRLLGGAS